MNRPNLAASRPQGWSSFRRATVIAGSSLLLVLAACSKGDATVTSSTVAAAAPATTQAASSSSAAVTSTAANAAPATTAQAIATTAAAAATTVAPATSAAAASPAPAPAGGLTSISVPSTVDQYFVLYVKPNAALPLEIPVSITMGKAGTTILTDGRGQLATDRYRVATFQVNAPGDVDADGVDDLKELADPTANALNSAKAVKASDGAVIINDRAGFEALSYRGNDVARDAYLAGLEVMKFWIVGANTPTPAVYFMNTNTFRAHPQFASAAGLPGGRAQGTMRGDVVWNATAVGPDGKPGVYRFAFQENDALPFVEISVAYELLSTAMPFLTNNLMYYPLPAAAMPLYVSKEKPLYDASRVPVLVKA